MNPIASPRICRHLARDLLQGAKALGHDTEQLRLAMAYAARAHKAQRRKSGEPFIHHPLSVARAVQRMGGLEVDVLAAIQHDMVEDCVGVRLEDIEVALGAEVAARVAPLTKDYTLATSEQRTADAFGRLWQAMGHQGNGGVALVKLIDRAHNSVTSRVLSAAKLERMRCENHCMFAPLARYVGAKGLARFLDARPEKWWEAAPDFVGAMAAIQPRLVLA